MDAVTKAIWSDLAPSVRDLVVSEVRRMVAEQAPADQGERLYTVNAAAERLGESPTSTRRRIADGSLPHVLVPGRVAGSFEKRVRQADIDAFIRALAGSRRASTNTKGRSVSSPTKQPRTRTAPSLDELVQQRLKRAGALPRHGKSAISGN